MILARREGRRRNPLAATVPGIADGFAALRVVDAAVRSPRRGGMWADV